MEYVNFEAKVEYPLIDEGGTFRRTGENRVPAPGEFYICIDDPEVVLVAVGNGPPEGTRDIVVKVGA